MLIEKFQANGHAGLHANLDQLRNSGQVYNGGVYIMFRILDRYYDNYAIQSVNLAINDVNAMDKHADNELKDLKIAFIDCNIGAWHEWDTKDEPKSIFKTDETLALRQLPTLIEYSLTDRRRVEGRKVDLDEQFLNIDYIIRFLLKRPVNFFA